MNMAGRRPKWRAYLLLSRLSNLPTVWSNVAAGTVAAAGTIGWPAYGRTALAASLFYTGGMFLNDAFDAAFDRKVRPERPVPAGDVSSREAFVAGGVLLAAGELLLAPHGLVLLFGLLLTAAIVYYDYRHKDSAMAPIVMGICRGLLYVLAAAAAGAVTAAAGIGAALMVGYVAGLTVVAKAAGANARWLVPLLIAGISLVDALFIFAVSVSLTLALAAAAGCVLTLVLQRVVPGD
jgi:4-hydroxybenzoate polyprenyltransferase